MANEKNSNQSVSVVSTNSTVTVQPGSIIQLPFASSAEVLFSQDAGNLVITPLGGDNPITLENFFVREEGAPAPSIELGEGGPILSVEEIIANLDEFNPEAIAPAAGPAAGGGTGGGAGFNSYTDDGIGDGIGIGDLLPPTELEFSNDEPPEFLLGDDADGTITITFLSDDPEGEIGPVEGGFEDWQPYQNDGNSYQVPMQMVVDFTPADNEEVTSITLSGLPDGVKLFVGGTSAGDEVTLVDGEVTIATPGGVIPDLYLLPPENSDADIPVQISAEIFDPEGGTATITGSGTAIIDAAADRPDLDVDGTLLYGDSYEQTDGGLISVPQMNVSCAREDQNVGFRINVQFGDNEDGSETHTVTATVPDGWTVADADGGNWVPGEDGTGGTITYDVAVGAGETGLLDAFPMLTPPEDYSGSVEVVVQAVATEAPSDSELLLSNNQSIVQDTVELNVRVIADEPTVEFIGTTTVDLQSGVYLVKEDNSVDIGFTAKTGEYAEHGDDADGSETLTDVVISGLDGWSVETATLLADPDVSDVQFNALTGELTITFEAGVESFTFENLTVTPPEDSDADLSNLSVVVNVKDVGVDCYGNPSEDTSSADAGSSIIVDAVLDQFADVVSTTLANGTESEASQKISLGLSATLEDVGFVAPSHEPNDTTANDTDGSESFSIVIELDSDNVDLVLEGAPAGATLTETSPGTWTLTASSPADLMDAVDNIKADIPAGFEGTVSGKIKSSATDTATDAGEPDTSDNSKTDEASFSLTIDSGSVTPTVSTDLNAGDLLVKEDNTSTFTVTANAGSTTDELTSIDFAGLPTGAGWTVEISTDGGSNWVTVNSATYSAAASGQTDSVLVRIGAPEDSDADFSGIKITSSARDISDNSVTGSSAEATVNVTVDAVLDQYVDVSGSSTLSETQATNAPIDLNLTSAFSGAGFTHSGDGGADGDASELVSMEVTVDNGATLNFTLPAGLSVSNSGNVWTFTGDTTDGSDWSDLVSSFAITTTSGFSGDVTVDIKTTTTENNTPAAPSASEPDIADNSAVDNHQIVVSVTTDGANGAVGGSTNMSEDNAPNQDDAGAASAAHEVTINVADVFTPADNEDVTGATLTFGPGVSVSINGVALTSGTALTASQLSAWTSGTGVDVGIPADSDIDASIDFNVSFSDPDSGATGSANGSYTINVDAVADQPFDTSMGVATNGTAYVIAGSSGGNQTTLYSVDLDADAAQIQPTAVGEINYTIGGTSYSSSDFEALGSANGYLYGITTSDHIVTLDPSSISGGQVSVISAYNIAGGNVISDQAGATFANGQFYVITGSGSNSEMYTIDPTSGATTSVGTVSGAKLDGLAYDTANNEFWTVHNDGGSTYAYKLAFGAGGSITLTDQVEIPGNPDIQSIAYGANGKLWIIERNNPGTVQELDPDTLQLTSTFTIDNSDMSAAGIENLTITTSTNNSVDAGDQFGITLNAHFGDTTDGSEEHYFLVEVPAGFTVLDPGDLVTFVGGNGPDGVPDGTYLKVDADSIMINGQATTNAVLVSPDNLPSDTDYNIKVYTVSEETNTSGSETDTTNNASAVLDTVEVTVEAPIVTMNMAFAVQEFALDLVGSDPSSDAELSEQSFGVDHSANNFKWDGDVQITINGEAKSLSDLTSHGEPIDITLQNGGKELVGSTASGEVFVLKLKPGTSGDYEFELKGPIDHPAVDADGGDDVITLDVSYSSNTHTGVVTIDVVDDDPSAVDQSHTGDISKVDYSVAVCIDISTSMNDEYDSDGNGTDDTTRLEGAKSAAIALATELFANGDDVAISLSVFADGGAVLGTFTNLADFIAAVNQIDDANSNWADNLGIDNSTNYNSAVDAMQDGLTPMMNADMSDGTQKLAYFLSDGEHNVGSFNENDWQNFVSSNGIKAYAVAVGGDISNPVGDSDLQGVSYDPDNPGSDSANILVVDNPADLTATLIDTISGVINGNIFDGTAGGNYGADEAGGIIDVTVFGGTYTPTSPEVSGGVLQVTDVSGNKFTMNFSTGDYEFHAADGVTGVTTSISYTLEDWDGDTATGNIDINLNVTPNAPEAYDNSDYVLQSTTGGTPVTTVIESFESGSGFGTFGDVDRERENHESGTQVTDGSRAAEISANSNQSIGNLENFIGVNNVISNTLGISGAREGSALSKSFTAAAGDTVSFDWYFDDRENQDQYPDAGFYVLKDAAGNVVASGILGTAGSGDQDGSGTQSISLPNAGNYTIFMGVVNVNYNDSDNYSSRLWVDAISLTTDGVTYNEVSGNVLDDPMNDPGSSDPWGISDLVEFGTEITSVEHNGIVHNLVGGTTTFTTALGGTFELNEDGSYTYTAPVGSVTGVEEEVFTYTLTDISGDTDTADLAINVAENSSYMPQTLVGTNAGESLSGGDNDDHISGLGGDDTLYGGDGDDYLLGGLGDDQLYGEGGADRFVFQNVNEGDDTIFGFDVSEGDEVDLNALFDALDANAGTSTGADARAGLINLDSDGTSTTVTVSGQTDFSITLDNVDLGDHPGGLTSDQLQQMGIIVGDES